MKPPRFAFAAPRERGAVLRHLADHGDEAKPLAGGQSLVPMLNMRIATPAILIDINRVGDLSGVGSVEGVIRLGPTTRQAEILRSVEIARRLPLLAAALRCVGHPAIRARGTIGGSMVHADPAAELPAVALTLDAKFIASSTRGDRVIDAEDFFVGPLMTSLAPDELLTEVCIPTRAGVRSGFVETARRHGDYALVGAAASVGVTDHGTFSSVALTMFGVDQVPLRMREAEAMLSGQRVDDADALRDAGAAVSSALDPPGDVHASGAYRKRVAGVIARRALQAAAGASA